MISLSKMLTTITYPCVCVITLALSYKAQGTDLFIVESNMSKLVFEHLNVFSRYKCTFTLTY